MDTTIKVDSAVRDRLAVLAAERGSTIRDVVEQFATTTRTREEQRVIYENARDYIRENLCPELDVSENSYGTWFWDELRAGRVPAVLDGKMPDGPHR